MEAISVDLGDFVDAARAKVNPPGVDLYPNANTNAWVLRLINGFWDARIQGITALDTFTCDEDGIVSPQHAGDADIGRDLVQLIIAWTAWQAVTSTMSNLKSQFKAQAGPVSFEQQQSATVLKTVMDALREEKNLVLERLSDVGSVPVTVIDMVSARDQATYAGLTDWIGSGMGMVHNR